MQGGHQLEDERRAAPVGGLRLFDVVLGIAQVALLAASALAVPLAYLAFTGRGTFTVEAEVDPPYTVEFFDGRAVESSGGSAAWVDFPMGEEQRYLDDDPSVRARIKVGRDDIDARLVLATGLGTWLALTWLGLVNVRRIVRAALAGQPFHAANVGRLRWLAVAVFSFPVATTAMMWGLDSRLDTDPPVHVLTPGPSGWVHVAVGLGILALAEIFREGSRLRALDEATI
jgi:hypothetical protein